jgi:hypothetical protein
MRIFLIESGGFVGVPLRYEVDESALDASVLSALERAMAAAPAGMQSSPTSSAGGVRIRMERDDGSAKELTLSHAAPTQETAELVQRLRACAKIVHK